MMQLESTLTCPSCGDRSIETMPTDTRVSSMTARATGRGLSHSLATVAYSVPGSVPCPPVQTNDSCCAPRAARV